MFRLRDRFLWESDKDKRPSELEIKQKKLPPNTPTLGERVRRDRCSGPFWVEDPKGGYYKGPTGTYRDYIDPEMTTKEAIVIAWKEAKRQVALVKEDIIYYTSHLNRIPEDGEYRTQWTFASDDDLTKWVTTADSEWGEGYSNCALELRENGRTAMFHGDLNTRPPNDGRTKKAGWANMMAIKQHGAFHILRDLEWQNYTELVLRVRGDGRTYMLNIQTHGEYDIFWHDLYCFPLYTRGGPYWQEYRVPFSKFYFAHKGKIQDSQMKVPLYRVTGMNISLADRVDGPFCLEIEDIRLRYNPDFGEHLAYEDYIFPEKNFNQT